MPTPRWLRPQATCGKAAVWPLHRAGGLCCQCEFKFLIIFVRSFGGQERFNAVDITKWRIALTLKVEWFRAGEQQFVVFGQQWFRQDSIQANCPLCCCLDVIRPSGKFTFSSKSLIFFKKSWHFFKKCTLFSRNFSKMIWRSKNHLEKLRGNRDWHSVNWVHVSVAFSGRNTDGGVHCVNL